MDKPELSRVNDATQDGAGEESVPMTLVQWVALLLLPLHRGCGHGVGGGGLQEVIY